MEPTRRFWVIAALGTAGAALALLFGDVLWVGIPLGIGAWALVEQLTFTNQLTQLSRSAPITQSLTRDTVLVDDATTLEIRTNPDHEPLLETLDATLTVTPHPALTVEADHEHDLAGDTELISLPLRISVAGSYEISPPRVRMSSARGLFEESLPLGNQCTLTADPRVPRDIHVGTGGERIAVAFGDHDANQGGSGFDPGELREYMPGDPTNRIDWNATARLGDPYIREYEAETTRQTQLIVDHRAQMRTGPDGQTKLDYAREVATWLTDYAAGLDDPLGLTLVADDHVSGPTTPAADAAHYRRIRQELLDLTTAPESSPPPTNRSNRSANRALPRSSRDAHRLAAGLDSDDEFARTLRSYFADVAGYVDRRADDPLFQAVQTRLADNSGDSWLVIVTDDTNRGELLETVRAAATPDTFVTVFLLPSVLFDTTEFRDIEAAYGEYRDFETFRQQLEATKAVTAFEVGPSDRLEALLATTHTQRANQ